MHVHAQLVLQAGAEVLAVAAEAFEHDRPHRVQVDLVGLRGQQVLRLAHALAVGHQLLAGGAQVLQRGGHLTQRGETGRLQVVQLQHHAFDLLVFLGRLDHPQQIAQLDLLGAVVTHRLGQRAADRVGAELLDQAAFRRDHERRAVLQRLAGTGTHAGGDDEHHQQQEQQAEEHQVEDQPAGEVHDVPQPDEETGDGVATRRGQRGHGLIHGTLRMASCRGTSIAGAA